MDLETYWHGTTFSSMREKRWITDRLRSLKIDMLLLDAFLWTIKLHFLLFEVTICTRKCVFFCLFVSSSGCRWQDFAKQAVCSACAPISSLRLAARMNVLPPAAQFTWKESSIIQELNAEPLCCIWRRILKCFCRALDCVNNLFVIYNCAHGHAVSRFNWTLRLSVRSRGNFEVAAISQLIQARGEHIMSVLRNWQLNLLQQHSTISLCKCYVYCITCVSV